MSLQPPASIRIAQSNLSDEELAYLVDLLGQTYSMSPPKGWSGRGAAEIRSNLRAAANLRGIKDGVRVVTQTVDLRS
jgi:hypothetical protein